MARNIPLFLPQLMRYNTINRMVYTGKNDEHIPFGMQAWLAGKSSFSSIIFPCVDGSFLWGIPS